MRMAMTYPALRSLARFKLALATLVAAGAVLAGQLSADVRLHVNFVTSSGACEAVANEAVAVSCQPPQVQPPPEVDGPPSQEVLPPGGPLLPDAGAVPFQRAGTIRAPGIGAATVALPLYSDGTKITSWRVVHLDNARYIELTIAW